MERDLKDLQDCIQPVRLSNNSKRNLKHFLFAFASLRESFKRELKPFSQDEIKRVKGKTAGMRTKGKYKPERILMNARGV
jgi:hypothetical protein